MLQGSRRAAPEAARPAQYRLYPPAELHRYIPAARWQLFRDAALTAGARGIPCAVGGGLAVSLYTNDWHTPHDLDLLVVPPDRHRLIAVLRDAGFDDYYEREPYDRAWIYRAVRGDAVVDVIWALANGVGEVDDTWLQAGPVTALGDVTLRLLPPEELVWSKLYVVQGARCDWPDIMNVLAAVSRYLDWERLVARCAATGDEPLLASALLLFAWLAPGLARDIPEPAWQALHLRRPAQDAPLISRARVDRLDSRPWFSETLLATLQR